MTARLAQATLLAQAGGGIDEASRAVVRPLHVSTTFIRDPDNAYSSGNVYGRPHNETTREAEHLIAAIEGGADAMLFGSGMSASTAVVLALKPGDHIVAPEVMYWGFRSWLANDAASLGYETTFVDTGDAMALAAAVRPGRTKLVWLETPGNPMWTITDIAMAAEIAHRAGARVVVDSTVATPIHTNPLALGADIVMHSATKSLNGHSDVIAGALACARIDPLWTSIARVRQALGQILGPFEAYLLMRGMRTLDIRVRAASQRALDVASRLANHGALSEVLYPGLPSHPRHATAARQMRDGFGAMLSIRLRGGEAAAIATASKVAVWKRATSLGGVESLIEHRASIEGLGSPCPPDLLRLSVGIEAVEDLYADLDRALAG